MCVDELCLQLRRDFQASYAVSTHDDLVNVGDVLRQSSVPFPEHASCQREDLSVFKTIARMLLTKTLDPVLTEGWKGYKGDSTLR